MIPLAHDFTDERVLVFGGGSVGARKSRRFAREATVVVVSPAFADADFGGAERIRAAPAPDEVAEWVDRTDPVLVVAATDDDAVNDAVARAARERGLLWNHANRSADDSGDEGRPFGSVAVPATVEDGPVSVAVSTGGRSPALAKHLRERIEAELDGAGAMADLSGEIRARLADEGVPAGERREAVRAVVRDPSVWKALRTGESNAVEEADRVIRTRRGDTE